MKRHTFKIVTVFYSSSFGWALTGADGVVEFANETRRDVDLLQLVEAARIASGADIAELMIDGELRLAWRGPDMYQWVDVPELGECWNARGGAA